MTLQRGRLARVLLVAWATARGVAFVAPAAAETPSATAFEDLGFMDPRPAGARGTAIPALSASAGDASALFYNPASLGRIKRVTGTAALVDDHSRTRVDFGSGAQGDGVSITRLGFAGIAWPVPVLRGSLVPAFAVHRVYSSERAIGYARLNTDDNRDEAYSFRQSGATYSYTLGACLDLSSVLSGGLSIFMLDGRVHALEQYDWQTAPASGSHTFVLEDVQSVVRGVGARAGLLVYAFDVLQAGVSVTTPVPIDVHSDHVLETTEQVANDVGTYERATSSTATEYTLPYRVDAAVSATFRSLFVSAQVGYMNWLQAAVDKQRLQMEQLDPTVQSVVDVSAGIEWTVPFWPLRLRAGVWHAPMPTRFLVTDRIDDDGIEPVVSETGRTRYSAGGGVLIWKSFVIDAGVSRTRGTRSTASLKDEYDASFVSLQGSYWF